MKALLILAHGGWDTVAFVLAIEGIPWILVVASLWRGVAKKSPRWVGVVCGGAASAIAASFMWMASPLNWASIWAYVVAVPIALGAVGIVLNCRDTFRRPES